MLSCGRSDLALAHVLHSSPVDGGVDDVGLAGGLELLDDVLEVEPLAPGELLQEDPPAVVVHPLGTPAK